MLSSAINCIIELWPTAVGFLIAFLLMKFANKKIEKNNQNKNAMLDKISDELADLENNIKEKGCRITSTDATKDRNQFKPAFAK